MEQGSVPSPQPRMTVSSHNSSPPSVSCSTDVSPTHRALLVSEIAENIAGNALATDDGPNRTLTALALTCKALYEPAMDISWQHVTNFNRLLRCFPPDTWLAKPKSKRTVSLTAVSEQHYS